MRNFIAGLYRVICGQLSQTGLFDHTHLSLLYGYYSDAPDNSLRIRGQDQVHFGVLRVALEKWLPSALVLMQDVQVNVLGPGLAQVQHQNRDATLNINAVLSLAPGPVFYFRFGEAGVKCHNIKTAPVYHRQVALVWRAGVHGLAHTVRAMVFAVIHAFLEMLQWLGQDLSGLRRSKYCSLTSLPHCLPLY